jgi:zinc resistance-associated protein
MKSTNTEKKPTGGFIMKKFVMALAVVSVVALVSANAMARGMQGWQGNGTGPGYTQVDQKAYQEFLDSTADLRAAIRADRAEIAAIMAGQNPDAKQVRSLTENIDKNAAAIQAKAKELGLPQYCAMGPGMGRGMGHGMMGRGMGHGMGHGMRGGMMGQGYGNNCPAW